jgi:hypothetical protein
MGGRYHLRSTKRCFTRAAALAHRPASQAFDRVGVRTRFIALAQRAAIPSRRAKQLPSDRARSSPRPPKLHPLRRRRFVSPRHTVTVIARSSALGAEDQSRGNKASDCQGRENGGQRIRARHHPRLTQRPEEGCPPTARSWGVRTGRQVSARAGGPSGWAARTSKGMATRPRDKPQFHLLDQAIERVALVIVQLVDTVPRRTSAARFRTHVGHRSKLSLSDSRRVL